MIRITQLKLPVDHSREDLEWQAARELKVTREQILGLTVSRKSIDARKKPVCYVYTVDVELKAEQKVWKRIHSRNASWIERKEYRFPVSGQEKLSHRPVIVGMGPAGLFCGLMLARAGYRPLILERGERVRERQRTVDRFWEEGVLAQDSNVQFGEGGAGALSDGKLNTLVKDLKGRGRLVLETFVKAGAPEEILWWNKPHLGTDVLIGVVERIREEILSLGGEIRFRTKLTDIDTEGGAVRGVRVRAVSPQDTENAEEYIPCEALILSIGHSARDTFAMLAGKNIPMEKKAFAVGVRIEHPQALINEDQYGKDYPRSLPAASYKLTRKASGGRGVYSFCMCPGGYVVNASSEEGLLAVNGMSYQARDGRNANSAMIVTVRPEDFGGSDVLAGMEFQRRLERAAYRAGEGQVPVQLLADFQKRQISRCLGEIEPCIKGKWSFGDVRGIFPEELSQALEEGIFGCEQILPGFSRGDAVLSGVESRTSSPVRILRNEEMESRVKGLYPCGEGAGYAGGITSAAMDGIKAAEAVAARFQTGGL